jgi:hypothetical protein
MPLRVLESSLDLLIVTDEEFRGPDLKLKALEDKLRDSLPIENVPVKVMTSDNSRAIELLSEGLNVKNPEFLVVDEKIVSKGLLVGNEALYSALASSKDNSIPLRDASEMMELDLLPNQFFRFRTAEGPRYAQVTGQMRSNKDATRVVSYDFPEVMLLPKGEHRMHLHYGNMAGPHFQTEHVLGVKPRDMEQYLAMQYLMINPNISVGFITGRHGSGKTVLSYAFGIDSVLRYDQQLSQHRNGYANGDSSLFNQVVLMKAPEIMGGKRRDPGALPGDLLKKMKNHLKPYSDAHKETILRSQMRFEELFFHPGWKNDFGGPRSQHLNNFKIIKQAYLPPLEVIDFIYSGFIGGCSSCNNLFIVDEAQDYTPFEMKIILERLGMDTKIIIMGDPMQVRNPDCTLKKNGLTAALKNYLGKPYVGLIALPKNYRNQASEDSEGMRIYTRY